MRKLLITTAITLGLISGLNAQMIFASNPENVIVEQLSQNTRNDITMSMLVYITEGGSRDGQYKSLGEALSDGATLKSAGVWVVYKENIVRDMERLALNELKRRNSK